MCVYTNFLIPVEELQDIIPFRDNQVNSLNGVLSKR